MMMMVTIKVCLLTALLFLVDAAEPTDVVTEESITLRVAFLRNMADHLNSTAKTHCAGMDGEAGWNEFCDNDAGTVELCPSLPDPPANGQCILSYISQQVKHWPDRTFDYISTIRTAVHQLYAELPREDCGLNSSSSCKRDEAVCDRTINEDSLCRQIEDVCAAPEYKQLCQTAGQPYLLKVSLLQFLESNVVSDADALRETARRRPYERYLGIIIAMGFVLGMLFLVILITMLRVVCGDDIYRNDEETEKPLLTDAEREENARDEPHSSGPSGVVKRPH